ncbi:hypothetical protein [Rhodococcus qingshengii]|uniref:hypothetical protein n=1 Tax=Rhodococcus qingshengii TaxID=334542 RepID=UPI001C8BCDBF|nr:hypothetical protein [Rhodococcus qingshengii]MBX9151807.1 hypothetical protein [Rhodococcus qingshengii]
MNRPDSLSSPDPELPVTAPDSNADPSKAEMIQNFMDWFDNPIWPVPLDKRFEIDSANGRSELVVENSADGDSVCVRYGSEFELRLDRASAEKLSDALIHALQNGTPQLEA